jgi:glycosyltransferase involved in cell wall biosynthesis
MPEPLVTVIMPVYNAGPYLRQAVLSIVRQTFGDWELLIIDDGSTDGAMELIADIVDARIRRIRNPTNLGLAATLNIGIELARGEFIARMDQDDIAYPERLERQLAMLHADPTLDLVAVRCLAIDRKGDIVGALPFALSHEMLCKMPWRGFYLPHPTWLGRTEWFRRYRYAVPGPYLSEDQELLLRSYRDSRFAVTPEILFAYRVRDRLDWKKTFRTRKTILVIQFRQFHEMREWKYEFLAVMAFIVKVVLDLLNALVQKAGGRGYFGYRRGPIEESERRRWNKVLDIVNYPYHDITIS